MAVQFVPPVLQGISRLLPMLSGSMYMGSEAPQAIEYLMKKDNDGKIIPFPETTGDKTPDKEPDKDPDTPPSGIGEVLDLMEEKKSKEKPKGISLFAETYDGKIMENVFRYFTTLGEDVRQTLSGVMNTPIEQLEEILKKADPYVLRPNKILDLNQIQEIYDKKSNLPMSKLFEKTNDELQNIKVSEQISDLEDDQYGNIGTRGFTEEVAQQIYQAEGYDNYQKEIQNIVRKNLGDEFIVYRGTTTEEFDLEAGEPIARAGVSVSFNPKEAENFVSGRLSLPEKKGEPVLLKIKATPEMIIMKGSDSGELVLDGYSLNQSNIEIIPITKKD
tara:strand:+ start:1204 stop:2196 length:993 start_codon:yes stop_codon:yes gene_type:complete